MPGTTDAQVAVPRRLGHHLVVVGAALAEELWTCQIFVDTEALDELLDWWVPNPHINDLSVLCSTFRRFPHGLEYLVVDGALDCQRGSREGSWRG
jgi:hypothetical protein